MQKKYFMGAMTGDGFIHFFGDLVQMYDLKKLYILKGGSGIGKSTFITKFANLFSEHRVEFIYCSSDSKSLDGAIVTDLGIGIVDGTAPHMVDPKYAGLVEEILDLGAFIDKGKLESKGVTVERVAQCLDGKREAYAQASEYLKKAKDWHRELESLYQGCVDFEKIDLFFDRAFSEYL